MFQRGKKPEATAYKGEVLDIRRIFCVAPSGSGKSWLCARYNMYFDLDTIFEWPEVNRWWEDKELAAKTNNRNKIILSKWLTESKDGLIGLYADALLSADFYILIDDDKHKQNLITRKGKDQPSMRDWSVIKGYKDEIIKDKNNSVLNLKSLEDLLYIPPLSIFEEYTFWVKEINALDDLDKKFWVISQYYNLSFYLTKLLRRVIGFKVNNAFLKMFEIIHQIKISNGMNYFDNAALPGGFIKAILFYCELKKLNITWKASSKYLDDFDDYGMLKKYPNNWVDGDGDVTKIASIDHIINCVGRKFDLYTSDIGTNAIDYTKIENEHMILNLGQIILGMELLKNKGTLVIKTFTTVTPFSSTLISAMINCFRISIPFKPISSKPDNSEVYWIFQGYFVPTGKRLLVILRERLKIYNNTGIFNRGPFMIEDFTEVQYQDDILKKNKYYIHKQIINLALQKLWFNTNRRINLDSGVNKWIDKYGLRQYMDVRGYNKSIIASDYFENKQA